MKPTERRIVEGRYLQDILEQPEALKATVEKMDVPHALEAIKGKLHDGTIKRIVLTGMGSSFHILAPLYLTLTSYGYDVVTVETSELVYYFASLLNRSTLIIAVSQSGRSAEIMRLLEKNAGSAKLVGITNSPKSSLATSSDAVLLTHAGNEFSVSTKTYVTALLVIEVLGSYLRNEGQIVVRNELSQAASTAAIYLNAWEQHVSELTSHLEGVQDMFFVARGGSLAAAGTGALITKEAVGLHAEGMSSAAFRHGPIDMVAENVFVGVFEGDAVTRHLNGQLRKDVIQAGGRAELIGPGSELAALRIPQSSLRLRPILEILPVQMMTLAIAYLKGTEAGIFVRASKVTTTE